eukprot:11166047-Lingulodinium_polyedra.AAC.1
MQPAALNAPNAGAVPQAGPLATSPGAPRHCPGNGGGGGPSRRPGANGPWRPTSAPPNSPARGCGQDPRTTRASGGCNGGPRARTPGRPR